MEQIRTRLRRWGNSFGIAVPVAFARKRGLSEGTEVNVLIQPRRYTTVNDIFGVLRGKLKKRTGKLMREVDRAFEMTS